MQVEHEKFQMKEKIMAIYNEVSQGQNKEVADELFKNVSAEEMLAESQAQPQII